jgi:hypothetical protein
MPIRPPIPGVVASVKAKASGNKHQVHEPEEAKWPRCAASSRSSMLITRSPSAWQRRLGRT